MNKIILRVASSSNPSSVAGAIVKNTQEGKAVELLTVGAGALNQAVKSVAIARGYISPQGRDLTIRPGFEDVEIENITKTAMKLIVIVS